MFREIFTEILFRPLFNLLVIFTNIVPGHNIGIAIILVTICVRLLLLPLSFRQAHQAQRHQTKLSALQSELKKIQKKYPNDRQKQAQETMALYRKAGINPAQGCLPLLIQLPILIALYQVFLTEIQGASQQYLYSGISATADLQMNFLGVNLSTPSIVLAVLAGIAQFVLARYFSPIPPANPTANEQSAQLMASMQRNMTFIFPVMTVFIAFQLPAALPLYWVASTLFAIVQQQLMRRLLHLSSLPPTV